MASGFSVSVAGVLGFLFGPRTVSILNHAEVEDEKDQSADVYNSSHGESRVKRKGVSESSPSVGVNKAYHVIKRRVKSGKLVSFSTDRPSSGHQIHSVNIQRSEMNPSSEHDRNSLLSMDYTSVHGGSHLLEKTSSLKFQRMSSTTSDHDRRYNRDSNPDQLLSRQTSLSTMSNSGAKHFFTKRSDSSLSKVDLEVTRPVKRLNRQVSFSKMGQLKAYKTDEVIGGELSRSHPIGRAHAFCIDEDIKIESAASVMDTSRIGLHADESKGDNRNRDIRDNENLIVPQNSNSSVAHEFRELDETKSPTSK